MTELGTAERPLRVAIVGAGPAGYYAAEALFKDGRAVAVDMFDRLPTPYGLVRNGVAPDHQKLKGAIRIYERISGHDRFRFLGNVSVGTDITVEELQRFYDAVILSVGAETDRRLNIPGVDLPGSHTATEFVGWYNGHPDYRDHTFDLSSEVAVVIGQGNVAMDVSRILAKTVDELKGSDIAEHALDALAESRVREVHVIGRRGPVQAKFTPPEIKEIGELTDCDPIVNPADLEYSAADLAELEDKKNIHTRKNCEVMAAFAARPPGTASRRYFLRFFESPRELQGDGRVQRLVLERNVMKGEPFNQWAEGTGETSVMPCNLFFRSVGYHGVALAGVPFDEKRGVIPNDLGRVLEGDAPIPGLYVSGWIKRGPSGVIGTNKPDSVETVASLLQDLETLTPCQTPDTDAVLSLLAERRIRVVSWEDFKRIDAAEVARGEACGKPREKFTRIQEMLALLDG